MPRRANTEPVPPPTFDTVKLANALSHPYIKYGLAVALTCNSKGKRLPGCTEQELREMLAEAIEDGLNRFRMETDDNPVLQDELRFHAISLKKLRSDDALVAGPLAVWGKYMYPSIISIDKQVRGTFLDAEEVLVALRDPKILLGSVRRLKRSLAPVSGEINNGGKEKLKQQGSLFELACLAVSTLTAAKPAAYVGSRGSTPCNTGIYPDLELSEMCEFVKLFMRIQGRGGDLMRGKPTKDRKYRRPPIFEGNYPDAPQASSFKAVGLLAALGYWATHAEDISRPQVLAVLDSLKEVPIYLFSYSGFSQCRFSHHVVDLAATGTLRNILADLYGSAVLYSGVEHGFPVHFAPLGSDAKSQEIKALSIAYDHFYLQVSRFLQQFDEPSLRAFLSSRAEYPPSVSQLLEVYFVQSERNSIDINIVRSARILGQWINRTAYFVARDDTREDALDRDKVVRKAKAKVLVEFESAVMSATSSEDMLHRVSSKAGRLLQGESPSEAQDFYEAAASGAIELRQAQHLLIAFLRLRPAKVPDLTSTEGPNSDISPSESEE